MLASSFETGQNDFHKSPLHLDIMFPGAICLLSPAETNYPEGEKKVNGNWKWKLMTKHIRAHFTNKNSFYPLHTMAPVSPFGPCKTTGYSTSFIYETDTPWDWSNDFMAFYQNQESSTIKWISSWNVIICFFLGAIIPQMFWV